MTLVTVLHAVDLGTAAASDASAVRAGLRNRAYYSAGALEIDGNVSYDNEEAKADWSEVLNAAYLVSQNDFHDCPVVGHESGLPVYGPVKWNGGISQRSTSIGDLLVVDGQAYKVLPTGFKYVTSFSTMLRHNMAKLARNPYAAAINEEFDQLLTD